MTTTAFVGLLFVASWTGQVVAQVPDWALEEVPLVTAGDGSDEGHALLHVRDALLLPNEQLVVLSGGTRDIRVFEAPGRFVRTVGQEGEGPGEFRTPSGLRYVADHGTVLVFDGGNLRLTVFDTAWAVVSTRRVAYDARASTPAFGRQRPMSNGLVPTATYDVAMLETIQRAEGVYRDRLTVSMLDGEEVASSVQHERGAVYHTREGQTGLTLPLAMNNSVLFDWGPEHVVLGSTHSATFTLYDTRGDRVGSVVGAGRPRRATRADFEAWERRIREEYSEPRTIRGVTTSSNGSVERFLQQAPRGDSLGVYDDVEVAEDGRVWARRAGDSDGPSSWHVIDRQAGVIAKVALPAEWELLRAASTHVIVLQRDEFEVEVVRAYRLVH